MNVLITAWEYVDFQSTQTPETFVVSCPTISLVLWNNSPFPIQIYETLTDVISMLYVLTCVTRLPVYVICNQEIRDAFKVSLCPPSCNQWCCCLPSRCSCSCARKTKEKGMSKCIEECRQRKVSYR